jgi:hypothetical protein
MNARRAIKYTTTNNTPKPMMTFQRMLISILAAISVLPVVHQGIETLALFLDAIGEIAQSPFFDLHDGTLLTFDDLVKSFDKFFVSRPFFRMHDKKSFV